MARPGLPKKYAKLGFAKGWKAFKAAKRKTTSAIKRTVQKVTRRKKPMAKRTVATRRPAAKAAPAKRKRKVGLLPAGVIKVLIDGGLIGTPALVSPLAIKEIPWIKEQKTWIKSLVLVGTGITSMWLFKRPWQRKMAFGVSLGGGFLWAIEKWPGLSMGKGREFTMSELESLQSMGRPIAVPTMGRPVDIPTMGIPVDIPMSGAGGYSNRISNR